ncbi:MAG TPA: extracellular solute-binding protein [Alphaproteobacteria bacterium]|jgi:iron(III) transport system substrate-binding protein
MTISKLFAGALASCAVLMSVPAFAQEAPKQLPAATKKMLADLKLDPSILSGLDDELKVPQEWIDGARKEGAVKVISSWDVGQYKKMIAPFLERYPFIKQEYSRGSRQERAMKPLLAYQSGRVLVDLIGGMGAAYALFRDAGALVDLREIPGFNNVPVGMRDEDGSWVGQRLRYWCMAYNTDKVPKDQLPKTWDDLNSNPFWRDGKLGLSNRPNLWLSNVWAEYGDDWGKAFTTKLFNETKPQIRKEGNNSMLALVIAGEFYGAIPGAAYRTRQYVDKGAPISWHCPEPIPVALSELAMLKGSPDPNAARLWTNWSLSKEGQIAQFYAENSPPVHKDLQLDVFLSFRDQIVGKKIAYQNPVKLDEEQQQVLKVWNPLWEGMGGQARDPNDESSE